MFRAIAAFELKYNLKSPLFYILLIVFSLLTFAAVTSDGITLGGGVGNVNRNAPAVILTFLNIFSTLGMFVAIALTAQPLLRDFELGTDELFFSTPMRKSGYLWGRFAAGLLMSLVVLVISAAAMI